MSGCARKGCTTFVTVAVQLVDPGSRFPVYARLCEQHRAEAQAAGHLVERPTTTRRPVARVVVPPSSPAPVAEPVTVDTTPEEPMRTRIDTSPDRIRELVSKGATLHQIADKLGVSKSTAHRRLSELGLRTKWGAASGATPFAPSSPVAVQAAPATDDPYAAALAKLDADLFSVIDRGAKDQPCVSVVALLDDGFAVMANKLDGTHSVAKL